MSESTDGGGYLRAEFIRVVDIIYREQCNLQPGTNVLIIADSRTPRHVISAFMGGAMALGAEVMVAENKVPPPPSVQPGVKWNKMIAATSREADLIVDLAVGYAQFIVDAVMRGARVIMPGDGTGAHHIEESLIRTILAADIHALRREADQIADLFTQASRCHITSEEGTDIEFDIAGLEGGASDGFLWDPDKGDWKSAWAITPPAQPGIVVPKGSGDGIIAVDGFLLYEPAYDHETPTSPVYLTIENGRLVDIKGHPLFAGRLRHWLESLPDDSGYYGPIHFNLGTNPRAMLTQHLEFERIRGTIDFGFGDNSMLAPLMGEDFPTVKSDVHWDLLIMRPTMKLDDRVIVENGIMPEEPPST
jgi:leucyl aminopeptidase (aminopeptidase T)